MQTGQDWERVIISKNKKGGGSGGGSGGGGGGGPAPGEKKFAAGSNSAGRTGGNMAKLDNETEVLSHQKVGLNLGKSIQQSRAAKGLTQAKLAQAINEKPAVINQYESGKAIPNGQIIAKIEKVLGTKLPRPKKK